MKGSIRPVYKRARRQPPKGDSDDQIPKLFNELAGEDWLQKNCAAIEHGAQAVLRNLNLSDVDPAIGLGDPDESLPPAARLARDALLMARWIVNTHKPTRDHLHHALVLGGLYERLRAESDLAEPIERSRRIIEGAAKGGKEKHRRNAKAVATQWDAMVSKAKQLNAVGYDRTSMLDALAKVGARFAVKRSTIEKNPRIRQYLPRARRKSAR